MVETIATHYDWDFDRVAENQIAMTLEGQWRTYALTLAWSPSDETLRLLCTYELDPPAERLPALYELLNRMNDLCWAGAFTWWGEEKMMVFRYGLVLAGDQVASARADGHHDPRRGDERRAVLSGGPARRLGRPGAQGRDAGRHRRGLRAGLTRRPHRSSPPGASPRGLCPVEAPLRRP